MILLKILYFVTVGALIWILINVKQGLKFGESPGRGLRDPSGERISIYNRVDDEALSKTGLKS